MDTMIILSKTQSICPVCRRPVAAYYIQEDGGSDGTCETACDGDMNAVVFFVQDCPEHGRFRTLASERADDFKEWVKNPVINIPPKQAITGGMNRRRGHGENEGLSGLDSECPLHCGNCPDHLQTACCVLIDVTRRCNQHCPYCFAEAGDTAPEISELLHGGSVQFKQNFNSAEPSLEEIGAKYDWLIEQGEEGREFNIQLSGGEPTVREDLPEIIRMARDKGFQYIQINSNGRRLAEEEGYAQVLKDAGASVIFMQFDGTGDDIYMKLRGEPLFNKKVQAIRNCEKAGLAVTLVPTVVRGVNDDNIGEIMDFLVENVNVVKGVHFQPASFFGRYPEGDEPEGRITMFGLLRELEAQRPAFKYSDSLPISTGHTLCCFYSTYIREPDGSIRCTISPKQREKGVSCCETAMSSGCCDTGTSGSCCDATALDNYSDMTRTDGCCNIEPIDSCCGVAKTDNCCDTTTLNNCCGEPGNGVVSVGCCDMTRADQLEVIKKDRDYVLDKWDMKPPEEACFCCKNSETDFAETKYKSSEEITDMDEFLKYYRRNTFTVTGMAFQDLTNLDAERLKRCRVVQLTDDYRLIPFCAYNTIYR